MLELRTASAGRRHGTLLAHERLSWPYPGSSTYECPHGRVSRTSGGPARLRAGSSVLALRRKNRSGRRSAAAGHRSRWGAAARAAATRRTAVTPRASGGRKESGNGRILLHPLVRGGSRSRAATAPERQSRREADHLARPGCRIVVRHPHHQGEACRGRRRGSPHGDSCRVR